jgi:hypothetical protein
MFQEFMLVFHNSTSYVHRALLLIFFFFCMIAWREKMFKQRPQSWWKRPGRSDGQICKILDPPHRSASHTGVLPHLHDSHICLYYVLDPRLIYSPIYHLMLAFLLMPSRVRTILTRTICSEDAALSLTTLRDVTHLTFRQLFSRLSWILRVNSYHSQSAIWIMNVYLSLINYSP